MKPVILAGGLGMRLVEETPNFHFDRFYGTGYIAPMMGAGAPVLNWTIAPLETT
jgi:hypothetical protein